MVRGLFQMLFGGRNVIKETVEVFRPNAEKADQRSAEAVNKAMNQYQNEFGQPGAINGLADGMNRMGRPIITYGVVFLFVSAMYDPIWFAARMQGLVLVPEQLWYILGIVVSFFFGAREFSKIRSKDMAKEAARITAAVPQVVQNIQTLREYSALSPGIAEGGDLPDTANPAVYAWRKYMGIKE